VKGSDNLFRAAGGLDENYGYSTRLERFDGSRADSAAQYCLTIPQRIDKSGVAGMSRGAVARSGSVPVTTRIGAGLDESHLPILGFEDEELPAAPEVGGKVDSIVRRYSDLHVRFSLVDSNSSKPPAAISEQPVFIAAAPMFPVAAFGRAEPGSGPRRGRAQSHWPR
jgi:hypothetical protein